MSVQTVATGSETTWAPAGTTVDGCPPKVSGRLVPGRIAETPAAPPAGNATDAAVIGSAVPPKALENRTRRVTPAIAPMSTHESGHAVSGDHIGLPVGESG